MAGAVYTGIDTRAASFRRAEEGRGQCARNCS